ncbi:MAG TPA: TOBE domain-containing protein, partial [Blastocatellia bacterium]|nr:TOBE domain-containing protein [Blastocatellia bacterium]
HSREEAVSLGERVIVYDRGRVIAQGEPVTVFGSPRITRVARLAGVENIFDGEVVQNNIEGGTLTVKITDGTGERLIEIPPVADLPAGGSKRERVKVAVPPGDILLAAEEPRRTSARNILRGRITAIEDRADRVEVRVQSGVVWVVSVTRQSVKELGLVKDQEVWLAIKTHSCYLLDREP